MIRDLQYPADARKAIDSLQKGLKYDAAVAVLGNACSKLPVQEGGEPDFSTGIRYGNGEADKAVRRDTPALCSRFSLISMVSRFEAHAQNLLLQRRVLESLGATGKKMDPKTMWNILRQVNLEARRGPVEMCSKLVVTNPSPELLARMKWLEGIYRVRNCLAHRLGRVQMIDVKPPGKPLDETTDDDRLRAIWLGPKVTVDGKEVSSFPHKVSGEGKMNVRFEEYEREWKISDKIDINPTDCQCIAISLALLANQLLADFEREMNKLLSLKQR